MRHRWTYRSRILAAVILVALLALPSLGTAPALGGPMRITQVTVKEFSGKLVIGIVATGRILYNVTEVSQPRPQVIVDLLDAVLDASARVTVDVGKENLLRVRTGQFRDAPPIARVVLDLVRPITVDVQQTAPNVLVLNVPLSPVTAREIQQAASRSPVPPGTGVVAVAAQAQAQAPTPPDQLKLVEFRGAALADVLTALARMCGYNIVTDSSVQGTITLRLVDVTCEEALRFVLEANNLAFRRLGKNLIISSAEKLAPPPEVPETIAYRLSFGDPNAIRAAIAAAVPGVRVAIDARTNALLVTGTSLQHDEVRKVLATLDVKIPQVVIQVHAIDIATSVLRDLGLFGGLGEQPNGFGSIILDSGQNRISLSLVSTDLFIFRLNALVTEAKARILSAPRIATLDGNKATILIGEKFPVFTTTATTPPTTTVSFQDVGVKLEVTPRVNAGDQITINLKPEVSRVLQVITLGTSSAPRVGTRSAETTLTVRNGQTIVMGGLISQEERKTTTKVPILGDIPILGELFKFTSTETNESEVIFLITPQIIPDTAP